MAYFLLERVVVNARILYLPMDMPNVGVIMVQTLRLRVHNLQFWPVGG